MPIIEVFETSRRPTAASAATPSDLFIQQQFEAGLQWLESRGVRVERHTISLSGLLAVDNDTVKTAIELQGEGSLPIVILDGNIISIGGHPTRAGLMVSAGYKTSDDPGFLGEVSALVAKMKAALAANDTEMFLLDCKRALSMGLSAEELRGIAESAKTVNRETIQDETLTKVEEFLAFGATGNPRAPRCSCSRNT